MLEIVPLKTPEIDLVDKHFRTQRNVMRAADYGLERGFCALSACEMSPHSRNADQAREFPPMRARKSGF